MILNISLLWEQGVHIRKGLKKTLKEDMFLQGIPEKTNDAYAYAKRKKFIVTFAIFI